MRRKFSIVVSFYMLALIYLFIFFYIPLLTILKESLLVGGSLTFSKYFEVLNKPIVLSSVKFTLIESILSTTISVFLGLPIALILTKYRFRGKTVFESFLLVPFILPGIVVGLAFLFLFNQTGLIPNLFRNFFGLEVEGTFWGFLGVILAHAYYNSPLVAVMTASVWRRVDPEIEEVAETLGVYGLKKFTKVTLPLIMPGLLSSALLTFIFSFSSFEIVLLLGNFRFRTIEVEIYHLFRNRLDFSGAAALATLQLIIIIILTAFYFSTLQKYTDVRKAGRTSKIIEEKLFRSNKKNIILTIYLTIFILFQVFPMILTLFYSIYDPVRKQFTLSGFAGIFSTEYNPYLGSSPISAPINTIIFSTITAAVSLLLGLISAYATRETGFFSIISNVAIFVPLATSRLTISLGMILAFGSIGILYQDTRPLIIASHIMIAYPFTTRSILNGMSKIDPRLIESAETLGAKPFIRFIKIDIPLLSPSLVVASSLAFATSLGEFAATNVLYRGNFPTLTVLIYIMLAGRRFVSASAAAFLLIIMSFLVFFSVRKYIVELGGGF